MKIVEAKCPSCGGKLELDMDKLSSYCMYCGAKLHVDIDGLMVERERTKQVKEQEAASVEREKIKARSAARVENIKKRKLFKSYAEHMQEVLDVQERAKELQEDQFDEILRLQEKERQMRRAMTPEERAEEEANEKKGMRVVIVMLVVLFAVWGIFSLSQNQEVVNFFTNKVEMPASSSTFKEKSYQTAQQMLEDAGFTNISISKIESTGFWSFVYTEGEVYQITVNGEDTFNKGDSYPRDAKINITYVYKE